MDSATTKPSAAAKVLKQPANLKPDQCSGSTGIQTPQAKSGEIRISAGMMFQLSQVLDINLPWVTGFELVHLIKSHSVLKDVPVIMLSGKKSTEDIQRAMALGANDFIAKPFDVDFLLNAIRKNLPQTG